MALILLVIKMSFGELKWRDPFLEIDEQEYVKTSVTSNQDMEENEVVETKTIKKNGDEYNFRAFFLILRLKVVILMLLALLLVLSIMCLVRIEKNQTILRRMTTLQTSAMMRFGWLRETCWCLPVEF